MSRAYQICTNCVMDTTDPEISFDDKGVCNHCRRYETVTKPAWQKVHNNQPYLEAMIERIKASGKGQEYDCIIGLSGGVDSSYVAHIAKQYGLRPLAVHFDSGWNSELAVSNIENIVNKCNFDLYTLVCDWEEMKSLQLAFFKSSIANCDIPQDHAFVAALYKIAAKKKIKYIISGHNVATESILPKAWGYTSRDLIHIRDINKRFGTRPLKKYPTISFFRTYVYYPYVKGIKTFNILDALPYNKVEAKSLLMREFGWKDYGGKHYESQFTKFFQSYYLPYKFGYDKRRAHFSSLIVTEQIDRETSINELKKPVYDENQIAEDRAYVAKKLGITDDEFKNIIALPNKTYKDYRYNKIIDYFREKRFS